MEYTIAGRCGGDKQAASAWFALSLKLGIDLKRALAGREGEQLEIVFYSDSSGAVLVNGNVAFDVKVSAGDLVEPYTIVNGDDNDDNDDDDGRGGRQLNYCGPVLGRCVVDARIGAGASSSSSSSSSSSFSSAGQGQRHRVDRPKLVTLDTDAVKAATSLAHNISKQPKQKRATDQGDTTASRRENKGSQKNRHKKSKRVEVVEPTSCAILRSVPLHATLAELSIFLFGLSVVEMFALPHNALDLDARDEELSSSDCLCDVYVVFDAAAGALLAQKRSGERLQLSRDQSGPARQQQLGLSMRVDLASDGDLFMAQGLGMRLCSQDSKSSSALTKLLAMRASLQTLLACQSDKDAFLHVLHQCSEIGVLLAGTSWNPAAVFDETLLDIAMDSATEAGRGHNRPEDFSRRWNSQVIAQTLFEQCSDLNDPLVQEAVLVLGIVKRLQSIVAFASIESPCDATLPEFLHRMHALHSAVLCVVWKKHTLSRA